MVLCHGCLPPGYMVLCHGQFRHVSLYMPMGVYPQVIRYSLCLWVFTPRVYGTMSWPVYIAYGCLFPGYMVLCHGQFRLPMGVYPQGIWYYVMGAYPQGIWYCHGCLPPGYLVLCHGQFRHVSLYMPMGVYPQGIWYCHCLPPGYMVLRHCLPPGYIVLRHCLPPGYMASLDCLWVFTPRVYGTMSWVFTPRVYGTMSWPV